MLTVVVVTIKYCFMYWGNRNTYAGRHFMTDPTVVANTPFTTVSLGIYNSLVLHTADTDSATVHSVDLNCGTGAFQFICLFDPRFSSCSL